MVADETRVARKVAAARVVVLGLGGVEVGLERRLGVDDDALAARELHDQVGSEQPALVVALARLLDEVAVRDHAGQLDDALELDLAPAPAYVRRPQRRHEAARLLLQPGLALGDEPQVLVDPGDGREALLLERPRLLVEARRATP